MTGGGRQDGIVDVVMLDINAAFTVPGIPELMCNRLGNGNAAFPD
ncbi:hypothetical protein N7U49_47045 [Streptomyces sp. AD2-2]|nr:hypothetical protein N7U49_47045 [Streptomyces sp. AD2-2]